MLERSLNAPSRKPSLGGWYRLGVVASALWAVVAGGVTFAAIQHAATKSADFSKNVCYYLLDQTGQTLDAAGQANVAAMAKCEKDYRDTYARFCVGWGGFCFGVAKAVALAALVPPAIFWIMACPAWWVFLWVRDGFVHHGGT